MMDALYSAATGMWAQQTSMDVIANNLANVNTTGFKSTDISFKDLLYHQIGARQSAVRGAQVGMGVALNKTELNMSQGDVQESDVKTNMAIHGNGFFQVQMGDEVAYTRDGKFSVDGNGQLVNGSGNFLVPEVVVPQETDMSSVNISETGLVTGSYKGEDTVFGQIELASFPNVTGLQSMGNNLYRATTNSGEPFTDEPGQNGLGFVAQGELESSNVKTMTEMIDMITAQRAYESVSKVISASDEMLGMANNIRR